MKRRFESALLGGAIALSGAVNRKLADVELRQVAEPAPAPVEPPIAPGPAPAPAPEPVPARTPPPATIPGMPLPTGYGLQVRGPQGESIVLPVCLPPGFELDSMMLCPEFLPRVEPVGPQRRATDGRPKPLGTTAARPAPAPAPPAAPIPAPEPVAARPTASASRLDGVLQLVFGADQSFSHSIDQPDERGPAPPPATPATPPHLRVPEPGHI
jgi:hypothetical protein